MRLADILALYRARMRSRAVLVQECFAVVGVAIGVALLFASQVASTSLSRSMSRVDSEFVGAAQFQLDARGPDGFDERLLGEVRRIAGVQSALPLIEAEANVVGARGARRSIYLVGVDPRQAHFTVRSGHRISARQLAAQRVIALPQPLAGEIGAERLDTITLQIGAAAVPVLVGATLGEAEIGALLHSPVVLAPIHYAQTITGMRGRISRVFVQARPGAERGVRAELRRIAAAASVSLAPADLDARLFATAALPQTQGETLFSAISALVGFMFALNAMLITAPARRRLVESIRPQGATRATIVAIVLFDAAVLGTAACVVGLALGELVSIAVLHSTMGYLSVGFPVGNARVVTARTIELSVGAGLTAAVVGVAWPLRDIFRPRARGEETARGARRGGIAARAALGTASTGVTVYVLLARPSAARFGNLTLIVALGCLLPFLFDGVVSLFDRVQRRFNGASPVLAVTELRTPPTRVRSLAIAATAAIAVFGTVSIAGSQANLLHGLERSAHGVDSAADVWVLPAGVAGTLTTTAFGELPAGTFTALRGVARVGEYRGSFLNWGDRRVWVIAQPSESRQTIPPGELVAGNFALARREVREGRWAVVSQALASEYNLRVGEAFVLPSPRPTRLRVAALSTNIGWAGGAIVMSAETYAQAWGSDAPSAYEIQTAPGTSPAAVSALVRRALGPRTGLTVQTAAERERYHNAFVGTGLAKLTEIRLLVLIAAVSAVSGALGAMIQQRRDLVAFIKCMGYRKGVLWRWLCCECALLVGSGCAIGASFGLLGQLLVTRALAITTGYPISLNVETVVAASSVGVISAAAVAIIALPGWLVARVPPKTASPAW